MVAKRKLKHERDMVMAERAGPRLVDGLIVQGIESPAQQLQNLLASARFDAYSAAAEERWSPRRRAGIMVGTSLMLWGTIFFIGSSILH